MLTFAFRRFLGPVVVLYLVLGSASSAFAQRIDGDLRGEVRDPSGAAIPNEKINVKGEATGFAVDVSTSGTGVFFAPNLLPGKYTVTIEASGFRRLVRRGVEVAANRVTEILITLEMGEVTQTVEVTDETVQVQTSTATLTGYTFRSELTGLPNVSASNNPINLATLAPGTTTMPGGMAGTGGSIGGNRPRQNNFVIDGLDNNSPSVTGPLAPVISEAVAEFTLLTNQFTAEFGHSTAGQFLTTTRSGANELHGRGWWFVRNRNLNALDNVTRAVTPIGADPPRHDYNRYGGQVGGRILRDKWFYFGAYEYQNQTQAARPSGTILVPTQAGLAALQSLAQTPNSGVSPVNVGIIAGSTPVAATQTSTTTVCNEAIDPACGAAALVTIPVGAFTASTPNFARTHLFTISQDVNLGKHRVRGRYSYSRNREITAGVLPVAQFNSNTLFDTQRVTLRDVWSITPSTFTEFGVAYLRAIADNPVSLPPAPGNTDEFANYEARDLSFRIGPQTNFPQGQLNNIYQFNNTTSMVRGAHTLRFGADVRNIVSSSGFLPRARGEYVWPNLDAFVRDFFPATVSIRGVGLADFSQNRSAFFGFVQDTWKVHPRVVVELGVRYEITETARDSRLQDLNALSSIPSFQAQPAFATLPVSHQQALLSYIGPGIVFRRPSADTNNIGPRVGVAWDVFGDGRTSLRAGFSIAHDVIFGNLPLLQLPPQVQAESRETNACSVTPNPTWCALVPPGGNPQTAGTIRYSTTGFVEGGAIFPTLPGAAQSTVNVARQFTQGFVFDDKVPETYTWSLSVQREMFRNYLVEMRYVGTRGVYLPIQRQFNAGRPISFRLPLYFSAPTDAEVATSPTLGDFVNQQQRLLAPFGGFAGGVTAFTPDGTSSYHGGSISLERRMTQGLMVKTNYTWSKTIDLIENELFTSLLNPRRLSNQLDARLDRGLSALNREHKFILLWLYQLPAYRGDSGFLKRLLGGWESTGSFIAETGQPVSILSFADLNGDLDTAGDRVFFNAGGVANVGSGTNFVCRMGGVVSISTTLAGCALPGDSVAVQRGNVVGYIAINPNAQYIEGRTGMVSNLGRNTFISAGINTWNLGFGKRTPISERFSLLFSMEMVNAFNHPSFTIGNGSAFGLNSRATGQPGYVQPTSSQFLDKTIFSGGLGQAPFQRVIQFNLKLDF